ncbi:tandem-95 repeat protein [Roseiconus lacunae]|uniref:Ig-like domain-containing protein n=1 Tax=Roseiconus lacunae TaxID=2605694 RepID=UPI00308FBB42|nr:tandem-95 repeat protein [Stieleria sp. HD01]
MMSKGRTLSARRNQLLRSLGELLGPGKEQRPRRRGQRLVLEGLERRQLLAGDVSGIGDALMGPIDTRVAAAESTAVVTSTLTTTTEAEGEAAPDLVQFAKDLAAADVKFYGAYWCPACSEQKALFEDGEQYLPFIEVTNPDRTIGQVGIDNNITAYPTWEFPDNSRETGVLTLQQLSDRSGVAIPTSEDPTFAEIGDQTVLIGSPFHIPVDAYDPNGGPLTVTVSVADSNLLDATVLSGNRSIRIDMETYGDMVFELFEQRAPDATGRIIELAEADFYDDIIFHRVVNNFVIQGGDPTGTGSGGSTLGDFDDDFHPELQHNRSGVLSFAKSSDDTNDSQFFVTEVPTRFLDFNHSVFGQLIEGDDVREAISNHEVNGSSRPTTDITINTIEVFNDTENSLIMLNPVGNAVGSTNVTVTVTDGDGNTHSETFQVDVNNDSENSQPYLSNEVTTEAEYNADEDATLQLVSIDIEGDPVTYSASVISSGTGATATVSQSGLLTVTPAQGFTGVVEVTARVQPGPGVTGHSSSDHDNQVYQFNFVADAAPSAPSAVDLLAASDSGSSDSDNITNAATLSFTIEGVTDGAFVELVNTQTNAVLGTATASGTTATITTNNFPALGDGVYNIAARQTIESTASALSPTLQVTYDATAPASVVASANTSGNVGRQYLSDLISAEEGAITYALTQAPSGANIDSGSGVITWTPVTGDIGDNVFTVQTTDVAGNQTTENFTVAIADEPSAEVKLVARDTDGNIITSLEVGQEFVLELVGVDARNAFDRAGVFGAYADILFDSTIVRPVSGSTIEYVGNFQLGPTGTFLTGLIDELGASSTTITATNQVESVIARVQMEAVGSGTVNIRSEEADGTEQVLLYGQDDNVPAEDVFYGTVSLTVGLTFTLNDDTATVDEDSGATIIDVLDNDTVSGSDSLSIVSVTQPTEGGTVVNNNGVLQFTPAADFNGTTEFTYRAGTSSGAQATATVTVTVNAVNDPPTGVDDSFNIDANSSNNTLDVLANDSIDPDSGETLTVTAVSSTSDGGTVTIASGGTGLNYTPPANFTGSETFTYTLSDGTATTEVSVTVLVASADTPPTAADDAFNINEDIAEATYDILANDQRDTENQSFVIDSVGTPSEGGTARISSDGTTFFYEPADDFFGTETVTYIIRDTGGGLATATVTFTIAGVNDAPPVLTDTVQISQTDSPQIVLRIADLPDNVDGSGETLTFTNLGTPTNGGTVAIDSSGNITYEPSSDSFAGTDTFTYSVSDGTTTSSGTLTVQVENFNERDIRVNFSGNQALSVLSSIRLVGTDALGNDVSQGAILDGNNTLLFGDVLPGEYRIEVPAVPFYLGAEEAQTINVSSAPTDGDTSVEATMGRLKARYLSVRDWLRSAPSQSAYVVVQPGESAVSTELSEAASQSIVDPEISLNSSATALTITGKNSADEDVTATVPTSRTDLVQERGRVGDLRLYRVNVDDAVLNYTEVASSSASDTSIAVSGSGEAESVASLSTADADSSTGLNASSEAEGEPVAPSSSDLITEESSSAATATQTPAETNTSSDSEESSESLSTVGDAEAEAAASRASRLAGLTSRFFRRGR